MRKLIVAFVNIHLPEVSKIYADLSHGVSYTKWSNNMSTCDFSHIQCPQYGNIPFLWPCGANSRAFPIPLMQVLISRLLRTELLATHKEQECEALNHISQAQVLGRDLLRLSYYFIKKTMCFVTLII